MGPVLGHTAECTRILTARVQMTGAEARVEGRSLGPPATPERVRTLLKASSQRRPERKGGWFVSTPCVSQVPTVAPHPGIPVSHQPSSLPQRSQISEEIRGCDSMGCVMASKKEESPGWRVEGLGGRQEPGPRQRLSSQWPGSADRPGLGLREDREAGH